MPYPANSADSVAGDQLRAFIERIERLDAELKAINDDKKEVFAEAKGNGFDTKVMKIILKERRQDASERMELEALVELYRAALGMAVAPLDYDDEIGTRVATRAPAQSNHNLPEGVAAEAEAGGRPVSADKSTGNVGASAGRSHLTSEVPTKSPASVPVDTLASFDQQNEAA